ncbi:methionine--tRNA ligase [Patescibacteria group bacterium]
MPEISRRFSICYNKLMTKNKYYLTTAIPYINAKPHIGHALEYVIADAIHRYQEEIGYDVRFISGADENALKNVQAAETSNTKLPVFLDKYSKIFSDFYKLLNVDLDEYRRGTDKKNHWPGVQKIWELAYKNGDIYKKKYKGLYCIGCASFKTKKDLVDGKCPNHDKKPEPVEEENYFFKLSRYHTKLIKLIESNEYKIYPQKRKNEILSFIKSGLEDFSISRSNKRAKGIGVPILDDNSQKIYVWFDALTIYMTASGWGYDNKLWKKWWPADLHIIGKDIIRFHAVYWPAMLLSAGLSLPKELLVHGFVSSGGRKMSKTLGNIVDPYEIIEKYGVDPLRYFLLSQIPTLDDGDFTIKQFESVYQADLANGLGNLIARVAKLCEKVELKTANTNSFSASYEKGFKEFRISDVLLSIRDEVTVLDKKINETEPWTIKDRKKLAKVLQPLVNDIRQISYQLKPFLPKTAEKIEKQFRGANIKSAKPLFPRL